MTIKKALQEATNALLDLQQADYNTYERPLKRLAKALNAPELQDINATLKEGLNFDKFVDDSNQGGSMMGSAKLDWPEDPREELGLALMLLEKGAADPDWFMNFGHHWYYSGSKLISGIRKMTTSVIVPFLRDYKNHVESQSVGAMNKPEPGDLTKVFIVHGHDETVREAVASYILAIGLEPVILHKQPNKGMTIPEKLAAYSNVGFAVVLLTADDVGRAATDGENKPRARQNVVLELGYFVGLIGRDRVCSIQKGELEIPSDYLGVVPVDFDDQSGWKKKLAQELDAAGFTIDWKKVATS